MRECCSIENARIIIRARERQETWERLQVLECLTCGWRWSA